MEPDERSVNTFTRFNVFTGEHTPGTAESVRELIARYDLPEYVPEGARGYFRSAQELFLHGWYHYPFFTWAAYHALIAGEIALRIRLSELRPRDARGRFGDLLQRAKDKGLILPGHFPRILRARSAAERSQEEWAELLPWRQPASPPSLESYLEVQVRAFRELRNAHAHPHAHWYWMPKMSLGAFEFVRDLSVALFPPPATRPNDRCS